MPHIAQVALLVFNKGVHNNAGVGLPARYKHAAKSDILFLARSSRSSKSKQHRGQLKESVGASKKGSFGMSYVTTAASSATSQQNNGNGVEQYTLEPCPHGRLGF